MSKDNVEVVKLVLAAFSDGDYEAVFALVDPDVRVYPRPDEPGAEPVYRGHEGLVDYTVNWYSQWDDYEFETRTVREAPGDRVLLLLNERGRLQGSGITVEQEFTHSYTVRGGKIVEWRQYESYPQALTDVGLAE
jgi:ketosteroid isomerase-like protein